MSTAPIATKLAPLPQAPQPGFRFIRPTLPPLDDVLASYSAAYRDGQITNGKLVARFEDAAAERLGVRHCVAVSSCTAGLMIVLRALGLTGEILIPSFTFFATGHAAIWNGLRPVFVDCDPETWTVDLDSLERHIGPQTSAILAVHLYGNPCRIEELSALASARGLKLIFDAAHAFGSSYRGAPIGQFGDAEVFSFSPTKLLVAGEGGLIGTNDATLARLAKLARNYGDSGSYDPELIGVNARMPEFSAALACAGLPMVDEKVRRHQEIARRYEAGLRGLPGVSFQKVDPRDSHTYKDFSIHIDPEKAGLTRDELSAQLLQQGIETKKYFYPPMHRQTKYLPYAPADPSSLAVTDRICGGILSLPVYHSLPDHVPEMVSEAIHHAITGGNA